MLLTIAIICKNEEKNIKRCLDSIFLRVDDSIAHEIILVDSYSTDRTIDIASQYPIKIIQLRKEWFHSPAAGRFTAFLHAKGKYTLCIDADMELSKGFVDAAILFLVANPSTAAVTGIVEHMSMGEGKGVLNIQRAELQPLNGHSNWNTDKRIRVKSVPGIGLFNTAYVLKAGNFHPFLSAEEEYELCLRLRNAKYDLWYIPQKSAKHYGYRANEFDELNRRLKSGLISGIGEMFKWTLINGTYKENLSRFKQHLIIALYITIIPAFLLLFPFRLISLTLWLVGFIALFLLFVIKKRNFLLGLTSFLNKALTGLGIFKAMAVKVKTPKEYPTDVIVMDHRH